jgi:hypothetical protein
MDSGGLSLRSFSYGQPPFDRRTQRARGPARSTSTLFVRTHCKFVWSLRLSPY